MADVTDEEMELAMSQTFLLKSMKHGENSNVEDFLAHHGVKGMKWGQRHDNGHEGEVVKTKKLAKLDKQYDKSFTGLKGYAKINNAVAGHINSQLGALNSKPEYQGNILGNPEIHAKYLQEYEGVVENSLNSAMRDLGTNASGTKRLKLIKVGSGQYTSWTAGYEELNVKHAASSAIFKITPSFDKNGKITSQKIEALNDSIEHNEFLDAEDFLAHFGVPGMKWGHRKTDYTGASKKVNRGASKDATEFARAKMFYGEGAGTRRKLIKAKVEAQIKKDPTYKAAFDHHLARQDLGKHANKAQSERQRKNAGKKAGQAARGVNRAINGPFAGGLVAVSAAAAYGYAHKNGYDAQLIQNGKNFVERLLR